MGDILKAISNDTGEYLDLCKEYNEKPQGDAIGPNPYGVHAHSLKKRKREELDREVEKSRQKTKKRKRR